MNSVFFLFVLYKYVWIVIMDEQEEHEERNKTVLFPLMDSSKQKEIM